MFLILPLGGFRLSVVLEVLFLNPSLRGFVPIFKGLFLFSKVLFLFLGGFFLFLEVFYLFLGGMFLFLEVLFLILLLGGLCLFVVLEVVFLFMEVCSYS